MVASSSRVLGMWVYLAAGQADSSPMTLHAQGVLGWLAQPVMEPLRGRRLSERWTPPTGIRCHAR